MSPPSQDVQELKGVLGKLKVIAEEQTDPSFRTYADIITTELIFSFIAAIILLVGIASADTLGELGFPTTFAGVATVWVKSFKDGWDKAKILAENRHNNMVFCSLMDIRINRLDNMQNPERANEVVEIKAQLNDWCKSLVGKQSDQCPYS